MPVFWLASEDHDVAEVDHVFLPGRERVEKLSVDLAAAAAVPAGSLRTGEGVEAALTWAEELLAFAPVCGVLHEAYNDSPG